MNINEFERGLNPKIALGIGRVPKMMALVGKPYSEGGAYSFFSYGKKEFINIINWLIHNRYTDVEIEAILRSKLMRWGADHNNGKGTLDAFLEFNEQRYGKAQLTQIDTFIDEYQIGKTNENMAGLAGAPGMGNAVPASTAAMTGAQQTSSSSIGSGDKWNNLMGISTQKSATKRKKKKVYRKPKKTNEENINPHDKLGVAIAKKMKVPMAFKKGKGKKDVEQIKMDETVNKPVKILTFSEWSAKFTKQ